MKPSSTRRLSAAAVAALAGLAQLSCGYHSVVSSGASERLCVLGAPSKVPDFGALQTALDGAREELSRHGALSESEQHPCLRIELLRVDEVAAGVAALEIAGAAQPRARGTSIAVVGRGWVEATAGAGLSRDTGDVRRAARVQASAGPLEGVRHDRGLEAAAFELGRDLARRILGLPTATDELP